MKQQTRGFVLLLLSLPVIAFYGLAMYPWNFQNNRGFGWAMLGVLYVVLIMCFVSALIGLYFLFRDEKKVGWLMVLILDLLPIVHSFVIPVLIS